MEMKGAKPDLVGEVCERWAQTTIVRMEESERWLQIGRAVRDSVNAKSCRVLSGNWNITP